ncbi:ANTAR domain-containing protein (plasmid) [Curtobacterium sp. TC1]|nr:ANTAR domain-containing protein [Curtobacterium sp. TC1]
MSDEGFIDAVAALYGAGDQDDLCAPFLSALPVTGVAISTLGEPFGPETVCASDSTAVRLDEIQFDLGEGPSWDAMRSRLPVLEPDLQASTSEHWPVTLMALQVIHLGAVFAFPMHVGTLNIGTVDLYNRAATALAGDVVADAAALTEAVSRQVLHRALARREDTGAGAHDVSRYSRREIYQASGMVAAQTGADVNDALLLLRASAYTAGRTVRDLANDVIHRTVDFTDRDGSGF